MKKAARIISLLLALMLIAGVFSACGDGAADTTDTPNESEAPSETEAPAPDDSGSEATEPADSREDTSWLLSEEPEILTVWCTANADALNYMPNGLNDNTLFEHIADLTNVSLDFTTIAGTAANEQLPVMVAAGDYCDLIGGMRNYSSGLAGALDDEVLIDVMSYVEEYCPNYYSYLTADDRALLLSLTTTDGRLPGFASIYPNEHNYVANGLCIRQDFLDALNMSTPETYDDLYNVLTGMKNELGVEGAMYLAHDGTMQNQAFGAGFGIAITDDAMPNEHPFYIVDGTVHYSYTEEAFKDYLSMVSEWYSEGLIWKDFVSGGGGMSALQTGAQDDIVSGKIGVAYLEVSTLYDIDEMTSEDCNWVGLAEPTVNPGDTVHVKSLGSASKIQWGISTDCENIELACRYIDLFYSDEGIMLYNYGVEGETYDLVDGEPQFTDLVTNNPDGMTMEIALVIYTTMDTPGVGYYDRTITTYADDLLNSIAQWTVNSDGAWRFPEGASITAEDNDNYSNKYADVSTYASEMIPAFITGAYDVDGYWDTFVSTINGMGAADCLTYKQNAYDAYISK